jgi:hypothetical protein
MAAHQEYCWIASRTLTNAATGETVEVALAVPEKISAEEWRCAFRVDGGDDDRVYFAHGLDAFQALIMALEGVRSVVQSVDAKISWRGGELGDSGFPRFVPQFYGLEFANEINRLIDNEIKKFAEHTRC